MWNGILKNIIHFTSHLIKYNMWTNLEYWHNQMTSGDIALHKERQKGKLCPHTLMWGEKWNYLIYQ